jgi:Uma2 family endonuclease
MRAQKYLPKYTVEDYNLWEGDWELIEGIAYAMSPSATFSHQSLAAEISFAFMQQMKALKECNDCRIIQDLDWIIDDNTVLRPDLVVICNQTGKYITSPPVIVVELLSPSTALKDRNLKYEIYEEQGVPYYIIIDPATKQYHIFVLKEGRFTEQNTNTSFSISRDCSITINLQEILAAIS